METEQVRQKMDILKRELILLLGLNETRLEEINGVSILREEVHTLIRRKNEIIRGLEAIKEDIVTAHKKHSFTEDHELIKLKVQLQDILDKWKKITDLESDENLRIKNINNAFNDIKKFIRRIANELIPEQRQILGEFSKPIYSKALIWARNYEKLRAEKERYLEKISIELNTINAYIKDIRQEQKDIGLILQGADALEQKVKLEISKLVNVEKKEDKELAA